MFAISVNATHLLTTWLSQFSVRSIAISWCEWCRRRWHFVRCAVKILNVDCERWNSTPHIISHNVPSKLITKYSTREGSTYLPEKTHCTLAFFPRTTLSPSRLVLHSSFGAIGPEAAGGNKHTRDSTRQHFL